ncbi:cytochrome BD oxidase subunit II [Streptomyces avermitilis]|uniref:Cytochrome bd-I oxidase subunit II (Cytochrome bd complex) n=2 Tax=Streptomyces avermitilis TaxID=33903 RepID=Q82LT6_STRAW|nr:MULTISPECIES: cytochrome d ubiquinol oxidase subunit II [Streptomyces]KUN55799.1 cytochrome BD oxidase subunit II [Streptomyces avermitilis]MYS97549.1 cytochrome d ubiquinol oxidase subunit II [Streptomyces sp. SID5469]OOV25628.1 cytochrome BD oxidase subunit II [Streptomyces avermitilis]BAC69635.1 putative cytochrome bd-I oxidase subunit II (cytochrome bd complex) [Streptomyces avermitilis MA-4680 = NBRC 14893]GDY61683.1 cytochrome D ubiquinol oxidase subunit II [Streptomyces avermitilis]
MIEDVVAWVLLAVVAAYACAGGADYGAGFWDLVAGGPERGKRPRWLIDHAMEPVWETNNVWLIFILVIMWTGFPVLFQTVFTAMWLPLALAAVGLVLRGAGFALRKPTRRLARRRIVGAVFALSSLLTPFFLGAAVGGLATGRVAPGTKASADAWANGTSVIAGLLTIAATAFLGAVFLTADARRFDAADLVGYFRLRAWCSLGVIAVLAVVGLAVTHDDARYVHDGLTGGIGLALVLVAVVSALATAGLLYRTATGWARITAVGSVALVVVAWGLAQRPYLIPTSLTVSEAAGASTTLRWLMLVTVIAVVLVGPPLVLLYRLDTRGALQPLTDADLRRTASGRDPENP